MTTDVFVYSSNIQSLNRLQEVIKQLNMDNISLCGCLDAHIPDNVVIVDDGQSEIEQIKNSIELVMKQSGINCPVYKCL